MWNAIKGLLSSKKAMMAALSALIWALGRFGFDVSADDLLWLVTPLWVAIFGIGMADLGKERAKILADTHAKVVPTEADPT